MWAIVQPVARSGYYSDLMSSLGESVTDVVSINQSRVVAGVYSRVPETILLLLLGGLGAVARHGRLRRRHRPGDAAS